MLRLLSFTISLFVIGYINYVSAQEDELNEELECLALNIYHEARSESLAGQYAVADVTVNRVRDRRYPATICGVVKQAVLSQWGTERGLEIPRRNMCQFSWFCDGKPDIIKNQYVYNQLYELSKSIIDSNFKNLMDITDGALWYHADYVHPKWAKSFKKTTKIGRHIFYRERG